MKFGWGGIPKNQEFRITHICMGWTVLTRGEEGGGSALPYKNNGAVHRNFRKEPLRGTKILFCGRGWKCFSPLVSTKATHQLTSTFFDSVP